MIRKHLTRLKFLTFPHNRPEEIHSHNKKDNVFQTESAASGFFKIHYSKDEVMFIASMKISLISCLFTVESLTQISCIVAKRKANSLEGNIIFSLRLMSSFNFYVCTCCTTEVKECIICRNSIAKI